MRVEVLVSVMNTDCREQYKRMRLHTDAIIVNQCDEDAVRQIEIDGHKLKAVNSSDRGIGKSRNRGILEADADIYVFADDDVVYYDGYEDIILKAFEEYPDADAVVFNLKSQNSERPNGEVRRRGKMRFYEATPFAASQIAVRAEALRRHNIWFSLMFGGGASYLSGEDSLFLQDMFRAKMHVCGITDTVGEAEQRESTWFSGYTDRYFYDKGALFFAMFGRAAMLLAIIPAYKSAKRTGKSFKEIYGLMKKGAAEYLKY